MRGIFQIRAQRPEQRLKVVERLDSLLHIENPELSFKKIDADT